MNSTQPTKSHRVSLDPMALIFIILLIAAALTHIIPAGTFDRSISAEGVSKVVPGSFHTIESTPVGLFDVFVSVPRGMIGASQYLFIVFIAGGLFHTLKLSGALECAIAVAIQRIGLNRRNWLVVAVTFIFGLFGATVGFENNIALVPIGALVGHAIGGSRLIGAGMAVGGIGVGFALSPINPYTVGVAQSVAELSLFSGSALRLALLTLSLSLLSLFLIRYLSKEAKTVTDTQQNSDIGLSKPIESYRFNTRYVAVLSVFVLSLGVMLWGVFQRQWYINEIAGLFLATAVAIALVQKMEVNAFVKNMMDGASAVTPGALVIGLAAAIKVVLDDGQITDTIVHSVSSLVSGLPQTTAAVLMSVVQSAINFFIPGGSGQALVTMPVMIPLGDLTGLERQVTVLAFQIGDGLTNLIVPTSGGTLAMLTMAGVGYSEWLKFIGKLVIALFLLSWIFLIYAVLSGYH